ncbi:MAG: hypothetical protein DCF32_10655 [Leptolyngbya sp.]|nr:MAG: hypothetical protein DCF32_10655 [Leptolyngbya sp.]
MAAKTLGELKTAFQEADKEYQFALVSGDKPRLTTALANWRAKFKAYDRRKRAEFNQRFQAEKSQRSQNAN